MGEELLETLKNINDSTRSIKSDVSSIETNVSNIDDNLFLMFKTVNDKLDRIIELLEEIAENGGF